MPPVPAVVIRPSRTGSRVANGKLFVTADGRSAWARRFKGLVEVYTKHIGGEPTPPEVALIRRIASIDVECEGMEGELAEGRPANMALYNTLSNNQRRLLQQLGFKSSKRDEAPSVEDLIAGRDT